MKLDNDSKKILGAINMIIGVVLDLYALKPVVENSRTINPGEMLFILCLGLFFIVNGYLMLVEGSKKE